MTKLLALIDLSRREDGRVSRSALILALIAIIAIIALIFLGNRSARS